MKRQFIYQCILYNNKKVEEDFTLTIEGTSQVVVKDEIEDILTKEWGWITKRIYQGERMVSDRFWDIKLVAMKVIDKKITQSSKREE